MDKSVPSLPHSTPEAHGISPASLLAFVQEVQDAAMELHSFMLLRHGHIVAEGWWSPYQPYEPHMLFSLSKSFTSTAAGLAIAEGKLSLDDTVLSFFPDEAPAQVSENLAAMRVRHLLCMGTGNHDDTTPHLRGSALDREQSNEESNWVRSFLARPVEHEPGTHFVYNSGATYMVSAIVQKVTGQRVLHYLTPRLFEPLGITHATWETSPQGIDTGGWGLSLTTEEIARFGQLYLQNGIWNGQQVLPQGWIKEATSQQIANGDYGENDWSQGYGFQFWRCRHNAYRGDGAFGQFCVIMPEQEMVFVSTAGLKDMQAVLNLVWKHLLPSGSSPPPAENATSERLQEALGSLGLPAPTGSTISPIAEIVTMRTYRLDTNARGWETIRFDSNIEGMVVHVCNAHGEQHIPVGRDSQWQRSQAALLRETPHCIAAVGAWTDADTFALRLSYCDTPFCPTLTCRFTGDTLLLEETPNVGFDPKPTKIVGHSA